MEKITKFCSAIYSTIWLKEILQQYLFIGPYIPPFLKPSNYKIWGILMGGSNEILLSFLKHFNITFNLPGGWWLRKSFINSIHPYPPCKTVHFWMIKSRAQHTTASSKEVHNVQFKWFSCSIVLSLAIFSCLATSLWYSRLIKHI